MPSPHEESPVPAAANWEAFYANYRKPGYVRGFEITTKLGAGMFGLVFKAVRQSIGKEYAIKFLKVDDGEVRRAVLQELEQVRYFAQVDHPNLVAIEDKGEVDGIPYIVMSYAGAETLRDRLPGEASTRGELLNLLLQACRGVAALHERSLVHFDLKPANVFLKGSVARVGDYGLSKLVTHSQRSMSMGRGTPYYMAPEMLQRKGDHRSDIYSLGVMLYETLCGDVPFKGDSEWEVLKKHETAALVFPSGVDARLANVVRRCMHKNPDQRFQSVAEMLAAVGAPIGAGAAAASGARPFVARPSVAAAPASVPPPLPAIAPAGSAKNTNASRATRPPSLWRRAAVALTLLALVSVIWTVRAVSAEPSWVVDASGASLPHASFQVEPLRAELAQAESVDWHALAQQIADQVASESATTRAWVAEFLPLDSLQGLDGARLSQCEARLRQLVTAERFDADAAQQLANEGREALVVAVRELVDCDLGAYPVSRRALGLQRFLREATGAEPIALVDDPLLPRNLRQRENESVPLAWALWIQRIAPDEASWRYRLSQTGR